jgi:hypothetical protein
MELDYKVKFDYNKFLTVIGKSENIKFEINDSDYSSCDECEANKSKEEEVEDDKVIPENLLPAGQYAKYLMNREEEVEDDKEEEEDDKEEEEEEEEVEDDKEEVEVEDDKEEVEVEDDKEAEEEEVEVEDDNAEEEEVEEVEDDKEVEEVEVEVEDDVETEKSESESEEEEEELVEIEIDDITYCTNDEENGFIYELTKDGDVGDKVGYLKEGEPFFYADEK